MDNWKPKAVRHIQIKQDVPVQEQPSGNVLFILYQNEPNEPVYNCLVKYFFIRILILESEKADALKAAS